jgi:adenine-specific DNA-methyltransferase
MTTCEVCGKVFQKAGLQKHMSRKTPCKPKTTPESQDFSETSKLFNSKIPKETRLEEGIFFTPKKARDLLFSKLTEFDISPTTILEPSFGTGELLFDARKMYPNSHIIGVEKNEELFQSVKCSNSDLSCCDFLEWKSDTKADLIIGNPPYFVLKTDKLSAKEKKAFSEKYASSMTGRPNIYVLFIHKCLEEHLEENGFLAFIIPTSLYNCSYYQPMRNYIQEHTTICHLENLNKPGFYETGQETSLIILQKKKTLYHPYIFKSRPGNVYISPYYKELYSITEGTHTLSDLGLGVKTGNVVWNQVKDHLSDQGTLLIYSSNINNCELKLDNLGGNVRKQYVTGITKPTLDGPVILVERGYGNSYSFNSVLVDLKGFYAENHINVIYPKTDSPETMDNLKKVLESFRNEKSKQFIKWFMGNGTISATDLETLIPIF